MGLLSTGLIAVSIGLAAGGQKAPDRPNIVLIMADDMGFSDLGCYGSEIATPNLDRLAAGGLRFTQFYNTARCCPTRASLLTGLYSHQAGVGHMTGDRGLPGYRGDLAPTCVTIAEVLRPAGYGTYMVGKWHVTRFTGRLTGKEELASQHNWPLQRGFDASYALIQGGGNYYNPLLALGNEPVQPERDPYYVTDGITDYAVDSIKAHAERHGDAPFFMYVAYTAPHWPLHALPEDIARHRGKYDEGWDALRERRYRRMIEMGLVDPTWRLSPRDPEAPGWSDAEHKEWQRRRMEVYAAQIDRMDQGIGRIVARLKAAGVLDNTLVMFLADNGGCAEELRFRGSSLSWSDRTRHGQPVRHGNDPQIMPGPEDTFQSYGLAWANASNTPFRRYKHWVHEGGISTPLIVHWPKVVTAAAVARAAGGGKPGLTSQPGHVIDLMATCIDVAGATYPSQRKGKSVTPLEGRSLLPILRGEQREGHAALFWEHEGNRAVRQGNWKLVSRHPGRWELYDLSADRTELNDLADRHPEKVGKLAGLYDAWARRSNVVDWSEVRRSR